jgi:SAM-dependent methyltransferase
MKHSERPQVQASHYALRRYVDAGRWASLWQQVQTVDALAPQRVLEIGPGPGLFKRLATQMGLHVETLDLDPALEPDHVDSATSLPFADGQFDVVCAFQMLEHLPYEESLRVLAEMSRVARLGVVVSVPDIRPVWRYMVHLPRVGERRWLLPRPFWQPQPHQFDGEHHWEVGKLETPLVRVQADFAASARWPLRRTWRMFEDPYYRFFVFAAP